MSTPAKRPVVLRTAAVWGTTVIGVRQLGIGQSLVVGDRGGAIVSKPDGATIADCPIVAVGKGWELDARGVTAGTLSLRGREEDPVALARSGAPIPIVAGDHGLLQYGSFGVFFQFSEAAPVIKSRRRVDWLMFAASVFALVLVGGGLWLLALLTTPRPLDKPVELTSAKELAVQFLMDEPAPLPIGSDEDSEKGIKEPGAKDKKDTGDGKKAKGAMGALGRKGPAARTEAPGEPGPGLGAMSEVLASEVGEEVQKTLGSIASVADALGGLSSDKVVLGRGSGLGMRGTGSGGGGDTDGVVFGAGTLDTGLGPGSGGGLGKGRSGRGGSGRGGTGKDEGSGSTGTGEKKVVGAESARPGQGLSPAQIQRVVLSRYGAFRACYESAAARNPGLKGGVKIAWTITPGGSVSGARIASSSLGNPRVEGCILRQFKRLRFPAADKPTGASYPFVFKPGTQ